MADVTNTENKESRLRINLTDLDNISNWVESNRQRGLITSERHVSFAEQSEAQQWESIKEQCELIVRDYRIMRIPDKKIIQQVLDYVGPEPATSTHM